MTPARIKFLRDDIADGLRPRLEAGEIICLLDVMDELNELRAEMSRMRQSLHQGLIDMHYPSRIEEHESTQTAATKEKS
jgi:hypothetical protein